MLRSKVAFKTNFKPGLFAPSSLSSFSTEKQRHAVEHKQWLMDPAHYENDFQPTSIEELEFVRSPFYDLARLEHTNEGDKARELLDSLHLKH
jgi:hypothetical protein